VLNGGDVDGVMGYMVAVGGKWRRRGRSRVKREAAGTWVVNGGDVAVVGGYIVAVGGKRRVCGRSRVKRETAGTWVVNDGEWVVNGGTWPFSPQTRDGGDLGGKRR
jgi:ribosomal protein L37AE/L43A